MLKLLPLILLMACNQSDYTNLRDSIVGSWWELDGSDFSFNVYLERDLHYLNEGVVWYSEYEPYINPDRNDEGGRWKLPNGEELEFYPSQDLKQLIIDEGTTPIVPDQITFSVEPLDQECYEVVLLNLPVDASADACPYAGDWK